MIVKLKDISKSYAEGTDSPRRTILKSFNLSIDFHESISIVGPSGCGKTTLLNILGTLDKPDSGEVLFNDQNVINLTDDQLSILRAQKIGFIFQSHYLLPQISVLENIFLPTIAVKKDEQDTPSIEDVKRLLEKVGLEKHGNNLASDVPSNGCSVARRIKHV